MIELEWCPMEWVPSLQGFIDRHLRAGHVLARDRELLLWQHPPVGDERIAMLVAHDGGELVGMLGVIPVGFCVWGQRVPGAWLTTWVVDPERRNEQVGFRLLQRAMRGGFAMVGTLGANDTALRIYRTLRFGIVERIPRWVGVFDVDAIASLVGNASLLPHHAATLSSRVDGGGGVAIEGWSDEVARGWDEAWSLLAPQLVGAWRDSAHLRRRFASHPTFRYEVRIASRADGEKLGFVAYRLEQVRDRAETVMRIVDLVGVGDGLRALAEHVADAAAAAGVAFADYYCTTPRFARALEEVGFVPETSLAAPFPRLFQPLDRRDAALAAALWVRPNLVADSRELPRRDDSYLTLSDCDQDRPN